MASFDIKLSPTVLRKVADLVYKHSGIYLLAGKDSLIDSRLKRRLRTLGMTDADEYLDYFSSDKGEIEYLVNVFTTNETSFFRTVRVWKYIEEQLLPRWAEEPSKERRVWSAACSTGEEAYSFAMAVAERNTQGPPTLSVKIEGTDICTDVVAKAKAGEYQGRTIRRLLVSNPLLLDKYFDDNGEDVHKIVKNLKRNVKFSNHNLFDNFRIKEYFDLVLLRNVLIYFNEPDQEKVLGNIFRSLRSGGILIIGESESLNKLDTEFEYDQPLIYIKK